MNRSFFRVMFAIISKDLRAELRSRELVATMLLFALLSILAFSFALELDSGARTEAVSGVLWVTIIFGSILGLNRSMAMERENGSMDAMLLAPIARGALFLGKFLGNYIFTLSVGILLLPLMTVLYNTNVFSPIIVLILCLGTLGISTIGTLLATMTVQTRAREALLPIAMLPVVLPVLLSAVNGTTGAINNNPQQPYELWVQVLVTVDIVYLVMCYWMFAYVVEE